MQIVKNPPKSIWRTASHLRLNVFNLCSVPSGNHIPPGSPWSISLLLYTGVLIANKTQGNEMTGEALSSLQPSWAITHSSPDFSQKSEVNDGNELWAIMFMPRWNASIFSRSGANILRLVSTHEYELLEWKLHLKKKKKKGKTKQLHKETESSNYIQVRLEFVSY